MAVRFRAERCRTISATRAARTTPFAFDGRTTRARSTRRFDCGRAIAASGRTEMHDCVGGRGNNAGAAGPVESEKRRADCGGGNVAAVAAEPRSSSSSLDGQVKYCSTLLLNRMAVLLRRMANAQVVRQSGCITIIEDADRARSVITMIVYRLTNAYR